MIAIFFAPFSTNIISNKISIETSFVQANGSIEIPNVLTISLSTTENSIKATVTKKHNDYQIFSFDLSQDGKFIKSESINYNNFDVNNPLNFKNFVEFKNLKKGNYLIKLNATSTDGAGTQTTEYRLSVGETSNQDINVDTSVPTNNQETQSDNFMLPPCGFGSWIAGGKDSSIVGCIAQGLYYALYIPTSWLFGGAGIFFDWMFDYSVDDESYKTAFVSEGWKIVRDLCNIFFIFILLYISFNLILGRENVNAKEMITNVIIIGLLINFSMFFARVMIDTGNILARVLYNSESLKENTQSVSQRAGAEIGEGLEDEISLSAGIVSKVDPQKIINNASKIKVIDEKTGQSSSSDGSGLGSLNAGHFILITLIAVAVNIIGIFVFVSVALVFVARVIGLWFIMIFAPFAFLSYIVPKMSEIKMIGWKNWISDLVSLSFVAPLFMFMLYLIILFLEKGFGQIIQEKETGVSLILSVIIPFVFIAVMLLTAKRLSKEYAGSIGQAVLKGVNTVAGVAGGVALGAGAIAARQTLGRGSTWIGRQDWLNEAASQGKGWATGLKKITNIGEKASFDARKTQLGTGISKETGVDLDKTSKYVGLGTNKTDGGYTGMRERQIKKEEAFGKTLGSDGKKEEEIKNDIKNTKEDIEKNKKDIDQANLIMASNSKNSNAYKQAAINKANSQKELRENEKLLSDQKEALETNKVGRAREYYQYKRKQSGKIVEKEAKRDYKGNITEYAEMGKRTGEQVGKQILRGLGNSLRDGGMVGGALGITTLIASSTIAAGPIIATAIATGALSAVRRSVQEYSGTYNRQIGDTASESPKN